MNVIIGQECICPDGMGRVKDYGDGWIQVTTYFADTDRSCKWAPHNVTLIDPVSKSKSLADLELKIEYQQQNAIERHRRILEQQRLLVDLVDVLEWAVNELESWQRDQGGYGTAGYDVMLPKIRELIKEVANAVNE